MLARNFSFLQKASNDDRISDSTGASKTTVAPLKNSIDSRRDFSRNVSAGKTSPK
jgi:hypothetical protein